MFQKAYAHNTSIYLYCGVDLPSVGLTVNFLFILCDSSKLPEIL
jgi:hypothetical protein